MHISKEEGLACLVSLGKKCALQALDGKRRHPGHTIYIIYIYILKDHRMEKNIRHNICL